MFILLILSFVLTTFAQDKSPFIDPDKFTVIGMAINSDDEKKVFQSQISKYPNKFNPFVELKDMSDHNWFESPCQSGIRCDQLIISGHFGGEFF
jgi:hypothetical protein